MNLKKYGTYIIETGMGSTSSGIVPTFDGKYYLKEDVDKMLIGIRTKMATYRPNLRNIITEIDSYLQMEDEDGEA